jgi:thioredoxin 2
MSDSLHIVCPHCETLNRIPNQRLGGRPNCGQCHQPLFTAHPVELTGANFVKYVKRNEIALLVDFWAPWCGPCLAMAPQFVQAAAQLEPQVRTAKVDTQAHQDLASQYQIRSIPTLVLFRGGHEVARQSGSIGTAEIVRWAQSHATIIA